MSRGVYERTSEHNAANSAAKKGVPHTSKAQIAADEAKRGVPHTSEAQLAADEAQRGVPLSPETCAKISKSLKDVPKSPEHRATMKNSDLQKAWSEKQRGGNDIINHHYLYDHDDLSLNTVQMTRSNHMRLHRLLQKLGYIVPRINGDDDINAEDIAESYFQTDTKDL